MAKSAPKTKELRTFFYNARIHLPNGTIKHSSGAIEIKGNPKIDLVSIPGDIRKELMKDGFIPDEGCIEITQLNPLD